MTGVPEDGVATLAAVVDRQSADLSLYAGFLASALAGALPAEYLTVERRAGLFGRVRDDAPVVAVAVRLGEQVFRLRRDRPNDLPSATVSHVVGGIVLNTRDIALDEWSRGVAAGLAELARTNATVAESLARITGHHL